MREPLFVYKHANESPLVLVLVLVVVVEYALSSARLLTLIGSIRTYHSITIDKRKAVENIPQHTNG